MIELRNVSVKSGAFVLPRISFQIESGENAVLMGTTRRGETTLLESIYGLRRVAVTLRALLLSIFALLKSYGPQRVRS